VAPKTTSKQGYNIGKPARCRQVGQRGSPSTGSRPTVRGPSVTKMFEWRVGERLGYKAIAERLRTDLDNYPPPEPNGYNQAVAFWTQSTVTV
jgi:hypothetical protein